MLSAGAKSRWANVFMGLFVGVFVFFEELLPEVNQAKHSVVIFRLHGRPRIGSTFIQIAEQYTGRIQANGGKLMLSGVSQHVWDQLQRTETFETIPESDIFLVEEIVRSFTRKAAAVAKEWLAQPPEPQQNLSH